VSSPSPFPPLLPELPVAVYHSHWRPACDERAFMLHAVGIGSQVVPDGERWSLVVLPQSVTAAVAHLRGYERENPPRRRVLARPEQMHSHAWLGPLLYVTVMLAVAWLAGHHAFGSHWLGAGALQTLAVRGGDVWRTVTAVTLHFDVAHLLSNLGFGAFFGWLASQLLGPGVAMGGALAAAVLANAINSTIQPAQHVSAGASTMVFSLLGLLAAYAWRRRADSGERWAYRWAPLIAGVFLLGFTGVGGENTDVLAHLTGFVTGLGTGWWLGRLTRIPGARAQWLLGLGALAVIVVAWWAALVLGS
jgi:membrane associated rhomboid family serine protease